MSSGGNSPMRFSARPDYDYDGGFDPSFSAEINNRMRVPKNIRVAGSGMYSSFDLPTNYSLCCILVLRGITVI